MPFRQTEQAPAAVLASQCTRCSYIPGLRRGRESEREREREADLRPGFLREPTPLSKQASKRERERESWVAFWLKP